MEYLLPCGTTAFLAFVIWLSWKMRNIFQEIDQNKKAVNQPPAQSSYQLAHYAGKDKPE